MSVTVTSQEPIVLRKNTAHLNFQYFYIKFMPFQKRRTQPLLIDVIRSLQLYLAEGGKLCRVIEAEARLLPFFCAHCRGSVQIRGASYEIAAAATSRTTPPFGGYHRLKLPMSCPFRAAHRTCSNAFAPSLVHRMCPLRFMR